MAHSRSRMVIFHFTIQKVHASVFVELNISKPYLPIVNKGRFYFIPERSCRGLSEGTVQVDFLVIGGGIGGLTAALAVAQSGRHVTVLEQAPQFSEIGAGLQLAPNAMRVLHRLGLYESIADFAWFPKRLVLMNARNARELSALDLGDAYRARYGFPYAVMHRADLLNLLVRACQSSGQVTLLADQEVVSTDPSSDGVKVTVKGGTTYVAKVAIGADGLWSQTRKRLSDDEPVTAHYVAYRGTIPIGEIADYARMDDVVMWIGPGMHFVQYPVRRGELYNQVAVFESRRFKPDSDDWGTPEELDEAYSVCCPQVQHAAKFMQRHRRWPMIDRLPIPNWVNGRLALLGDAAHPMLQYIAQGACQAIEDGAALAAEIDRDASDLDSALHRYEARRTVRSASIQNAARTFGQIIHTDDPTASLLRDSLLTTRAADDYRFVDWIYAHDATTGHSVLSDEAPVKIRR